MDGDIYPVDYQGAPIDASAWQGDGDKRLLRGGSWVMVNSLDGSRSRINNSQRHNCCSSE